MRRIPLKGENRPRVNWGNVPLVRKILSRSSIEDPRYITESIYSVIRNLEVTTITINGTLNNVRFNEQQFEDASSFQLKDFQTMCDMNDCENRICSISSNFMEPRINPRMADSVTAIHMNLTRESTSKKGRRKKDKSLLTNATSKRKKQGTGNFFHSQVTIACLSKEYSHFKMYNAKLFRPGSFSIPGVFDIGDAIDALKNIVDVVNQVFDTRELPHAKLKTFVISMVNFKSQLDIGDRTLSLKQLGERLFASPSMGLINDFTNAKDSFDGINNANCISLKFPIEGDSSNSEVVRHILTMHDLWNDDIVTTDHKKPKRSFLIEIYPSGKVNAKGKYNVDHMIERLQMVEQFIMDNFDDLTVKPEETLLIKQKNIPNPKNDTTTDAWLMSAEELIKKKSVNIEPYEEASFEVDVPQYAKTLDDIPIPSDPADRDEFVQKYIIGNTMIL